MKCAKVSMVVVLVHSLACLAQDRNVAKDERKSPPQEAAALTATRSGIDAAAKAAGSEPESYKIGAGDQLTITVWKETGLTGSYLVRPDGMISVPLLGDVQASVLTPAQLAGVLETRLKEFIQNPNVTVQISEVRSKVIYLMGEITKKGTIEMSPGMTLLQAIASSGGVTEYANEKKIYILRNDSGKQMKIPVHYKEALKGDGSFNVPLRPGDTIVVP